MKVTIKLNHTAIKKLEQVAKESAVEALEAVQTDLINSQTMPFDTGDMQNNQTFVESTENGAVLITGSPQARRLYYHPEYNFQTGKNPNAGAYWLETYLTGDKKGKVQAEFISAFKRRSGT